MSDEEKKAPAQAPQPKAAAGPKVWKYTGPVPGPTVSNLPGTSGRWRADQLPQQYIQFVIDTVPQAQYWWE